MSAGKAQCRDILQTVDGQTSFCPYDADGIDVKFTIGGTDVTFDVVLKDAVGRLLVAECRRREDAIKQEAIFAFAHKVELLRKETGQEVAGAFFAKRKYQLGAVKHASWSGIDVVVLEDGQTTKDFALVYQRYDPNREKRVKEAIVQMSATVMSKGSLSIKVIRKDGSEEDLGEVG
jgi:hypothetical protein